MSAEPIGVGVAGVGLMGRRHAENAGHWLPNGRLVAVFDTDRAVASRVANELEAAACGSFGELIDHDDVRVVVIASPARFHAEQAIAALSRGKDVLLEKPMAHSLAECDRIIAAAQRGRARLQIGFMRRYDAAYVEAKRRIASGALGGPLLFRAVHRDREAASSGLIDMMLESAIHDFDLGRFLLNDEIATVTTTAAPNATINAVHFARGALGDIETYSGALYAYDVRTEVVCEKGTVMIGHPQRTRLEVYTPSGAAHDLFPGFLERFADAYRDELADFVAGVRERRPPAVTGKDGRAAVAASLAAIASFTSGRAEPVAS